MQVQLDAVDWCQLTEFSSPEEFLEWLYEAEDGEEFRTLSCYDNGWNTDSARFYFDVAGALSHLAEILPPETGAHLREGIMKQITMDGHIDEFSLAEPSEVCYWITASPQSVASIKAHLDAVNFQECATSLVNIPMDSGMPDLGSMFIPFIDQHRHMVDLAVSNGYGLLGHCG